MSKSNSKVYLLVSLLLFGQGISFGQNSCLNSPNLDFFKTSTTNGTINFNQFPDFTLPFKIVYGGPRFNDSNLTPLKKGFSHLGSFNAFDYQNLLPQNRAIIWYGVAYNFGNPQPWDLIRSPWNNDLEQYKAKWNSETTEFGNQFDQNKTIGLPKADILMLDIERHWEGETDFNTDFGIFSIKNSNLVPPNYRLLNNDNFKTAYKNDMQKLYGLPVSYLNSIGKLKEIRQIGAYADVPIRTQFQNMETKTWQQWATEGKNLSYLLKDTLKAELGGVFNSQLNIISPSCYIQIPYLPNPVTQGGSYLAETLFQIEVNKKWTNRPIIPFVWLRYESNNKFIEPYQAEALAIFPFFAGASGLWLWENPTVNFNNENLAVYEHFLKGLYKLSTYKNYFEGNYQIIEAENPVDLKVKNSPVWRAVLKDKKILITAQNPYAIGNAKTKITVKYKNWSKEIELEGREVYLCAHDFFDVVPIETTSETSFSVVNPINYNTLQIKIKDGVVIAKCKVEFYTIKGQKMPVGKMQIVENQIQINNCPKGQFVFRLFDGEKWYFKRIINL